MEMKYIKIFIASSITEFKDERTALKEYISTLNDIYVRRGIYFELLLCEDLSNAMAMERKQAEYNAFIQDSQYFYILISRKVGKYTEEEFDVALEAFRTEGNPKIYTYFMQLPEGQPVEESLKEFMDRLKTELGHYYSRFTHIDAVKLNLLLELCRDPMVGGQLNLEDGEAVLDGKTLLSLENVPIYSKNETVQRLLKEKRELEEEYSTLAGLSESEAVKRMRLANSNKRNEIAEQLHALEIDVLKLCQTVSEKRQIGKIVNWREQVALEYVDAGDYDAAIIILRDPAWKEEVRQAEELVDKAKESVREYISGQRTLIQTLSSRGITKASAGEIQEIYQEITTLAEKHRIELDVLYDYATFLYKQNQFPEGIYVAERLRNWFAFDDGITESEKAALFDLLGILYSANGKLSGSEEMYRSAMEIRTRLAVKNPGAHEPDLASTCNNLAVLFSATGRHKDAEKMYRRALEIHTLWRRRTPEPMSPVLPVSIATLQPSCIPQAATRTRKGCTGERWRSIHAWRRRTPGPMSPIWL